MERRFKLFEENPRLLARLNNGARYLGGEFGSLAHLGEGDEAEFVCGVAFPDVYEIGMSNTSIKILYELVNAVPGLRAERVFCVEEDFAALLREASQRLFTLESRLPLAELDVLGVSIGFELSATNILSMLDQGGIPIRATDRTSQADTVSGEWPIVIGGGPALSNPAPFGVFFDALVIGEAEGCLVDILGEQKRLRDEGASRAARLEALWAHPSAWFPGKSGAKRSIWAGFGAPRSLTFPVPHLSIVQDHSSVEIMRGCPQGCRFCHAGIFYRPYRQKSPSTIDQEVAVGLTQKGYREFSLASLSSGDYEGIHQLYTSLNARYAGYGASFALPSLKVNSFTLGLLEEMSENKKSGLTLAVESACERAQGILNKMAGIEDALAIAEEAKKRGWKSAKLYFMIGLPLTADDVPGTGPDGQEWDAETLGIYDFVLELRRRSGLNFNLNVGTFVPKPHTPFQHCAQLEPELAFQRLFRLKKALLRKGFSMSYQSPFGGYLEGIMARGDARVADIIESAWRKGARFDAWDEKLDKNAWNEAIAEAGWPVAATIMAGKDPTAEFPWDGINLGVSKAMLRREWERAQRAELSPRCAADCAESCGICGKNVAVIEAPAEELGPSRIPPVWLGPRMASGKGDEKTVYGMLFSWQKVGDAAWIPHLSVVQAMERSMLRSGLPYRLSPGFNPHIVLELSAALGLGMRGLEEWGIIQLHAPLGGDDFATRLNAALPRGIRIRTAHPILCIREQKKCPSLGAIHASSRYAIRWNRDLDEILSPLRERLTPAHTLPEELAGWTREAWIWDSSNAGPRSLFEPLLGKEWFKSGVEIARLGLTSTAGGFPQAYASWANAGESGR